MIKILFFIETLDGGGAEKVLRNLVNNMDQSKFDITVQTVWPCDTKGLLVPGIRYKAMFDIKNKVNVWRYRIAAATGIAYRCYIKDDYDIECAYLECGATKIIANSTNKKAVKLAWVHCDIKKAMPDPIGFALKTSKYYIKFDKVVCVSQEGKKSFDELFDRRIQTVTIHNTVDREEIIKKASVEFSLVNKIQRPMVVSLGRLSKPKCYMRLLEAHKRLLNEGIEHTLLILGEGPERKKLEEYIDENNLWNSARLLGFKRNPYPYLESADLLVCSSSYECFSTFITEGLILGKPIVTTDVSGMRELLGDSEYGLITDNNDEAFYEGMKMLLLDIEQRENYSRKSFVRGKDFSTKKQVRKTEQFLAECMNTRR